MKSPRSATVDAPVTLLIADAGPALGQAPEALHHDLAQRLSRADAGVSPPGGPSRILFSLFGLEADGELPAAAVTRSLDAGNPGDETWLRADPAWMEVGTALVLRSWGALGLDQDESQALAEALGALFGEAGRSFHAPGPDRWYLKLGGGERPSTTPPDELTGRDAADHLPGGNDEDAWRRLMGECQMLLHNHPVNRERRAAGRPPVNSLWFWGAGKCPDQAPAGFSRVIGDNALSRALAALPGGTREGSGALLVADGGPGDRETWECWLAAGSVRRRVIIPETGQQFDWRPRHGMRVWRRPRPLEELLVPGRRA